jgi:fluoroacetyl-CoA thioesterase
LTRTRPAADYPPPGAETCTRGAARGFAAPPITERPPMDANLKPGIRSEFRYVLPDSKTVPHLYPEFKEFGEMPAVFATGFMVGLIESACQLAIKPYLDWPREQSLGTHVSFSHLAATPPGLTVTVECEVTAVEGRRITFRTRAHDGIDLISEGTHERVVIDAARFDARLAAKKAAAGLS